MASVVNVVLRRALYPSQKYVVAGSTLLSVHKLSNQLLNNTSQRTFIEDSLLKVDSFRSRCESAQKRYGMIAEGFRTKLLEKLADKSTTLLSDDFRAFLYLADKPDMPAVLQMMDRLQKQEAAEKEAGISSSIRSSVLPDVMRKYYVLNMCDDMLLLYKSKPESQTSFNTAIIMDLLYENGRHQECLDLAYNFAQNNSSMIFKLHALAIVSASKLNTADALKKSSYLLNHSQKSEAEYTAKNLPENVTIAIHNRNRDCRRLVALMCIQQNYCNAALDLLRKDSKFYNRNFVELNIKALAYLKADRPDTALRITQRLVDMVKAGMKDGKRAKSYILKDLFEELMVYSKNQGIPEQHTKQLAYISASKFLVSDLTTLQLIELFNPWKPRTKMSATQIVDEQDSSSSSSDSDTEEQDKKLKEGKEQVLKSTVM